MRFTDLHPCDNCGGKLLPSFYVIRFSQALINEHAINQTLAMHQFFEGKSLALAELFSPSDEYYVVLGEQDRSLWQEIWLCQDCFCFKGINLARLEGKSEMRKEKDAKEGSKAE